MLRQGHNQKGTDPPRTSWSDAMKSDKSWGHVDHTGGHIDLNHETCYFRRYLVIHWMENLILRTCWSRELIWSSIMRTSWSWGHTDHENLFDHPSWGQVDHEDILIMRTYSVIHHEENLILRTCWSRELILLSIMRTCWSWGHDDHEENLFDRPSWGQVDHEDMLILRRTCLIDHHEDRLIIKTLDQTSWGDVDGGRECKCIILGLGRSVLYHFVKCTIQENKLVFILTTSFSAKTTTFIFQD